MELLDETKTVNENGKPEPSDILAMASDIIASYVSNNPVSTNELPALIHSVTDTLSSIGNDEDSISANGVKPAVPVKKSIHKDYLICLEDGERFKSLKRHLRSKYDMSPEEYRQKWGLPHDYPMVAPSYSEKRSKLAKEFGLGKYADDV